MPKLDGFEVCRRLKRDPAIRFMPIILCTARAASQDIVTGLDAGADEYLTKPIDQAALVARVRSMLRIKEPHDQVQAQARDLASGTRRSNSG
jgi:adenylate cyclase